MMSLQLVMGMLPQVALQYPPPPTISVSLSGWMLIILVMAIGGYIGWRQGLRSFLTITLVSALAYLILISGGEQVIGYVNNLYSNIPKLLAILTGGSPDTAPLWGPLLPVTFGWPLALRVFLYIILVALAWFFNKKLPWYAMKQDTLSRQLGVFSGALTALIWTSAVTSFWRESGGGGGGAGNILRIFPDVTAITPWLITILLLIIVIGVVLKLPTLVKA